LRTKKESGVASALYELKPKPGSSNHLSEVILRGILHKRPDLSLFLFGRRSSPAAARGSLQNSTNFPLDFSPSAGKIRASNINTKRKFN
jgi:hypothetical protein